MRKFNLEEALAGKPVVTRTGNIVTQLNLFHSIREMTPLYGVVNEEVISWTTKGKFVWKDGESIHDLFMVTEKKTIWINVWQNLKNCSLSSSVHSRKDKCDKEIDELLSHTLVQTIEITE